MSRFVRVKIEFQVDEIRWIEIEDKRGTQEGVFVLLYEETTEPCKYDWWFQTIEEAQQFAEQNYGIRPDEWNLEERGHPPISE